MPRRGALPRRACHASPPRPSLPHPTLPHHAAGLRQLVWRGHWKMWLRIAKLGDLPADITPMSYDIASLNLADDLGYNEPTIASLLGHKTHSITSRYMHSADAVLLAAHPGRHQADNNP